VDLQVDTSVSEKDIASIFSAEDNAENATLEYTE
jgi:hypothetical protein